VLPTSPRQITLGFSEQLEPRFSEASVYDSNSKRVDSGFSIDSKDPTIMRISLPDLPSGVYTVVWQAISAVDGHHTSGSFPFGVGSVSISIPTAQASGSTFIFPSPIEVVDQWLNILSEVVYFGGIVFVLLVWRPIKRNESMKIDAETDRRIIRGTTKLLRISGCVALVATIISLFIEAATVAGPNQFLSSTVTIITSTHFGAYWIARVVAICAAIFFAEERYEICALAIGGFLLLTTALTSHNAASTEYVPLVNIASDWLHLTAVSVWVGGLVNFTLILTCLQGLKQNRRPLAELIQRFSSLAVVSVGVIGLTGLYNLLLEVGTFSALFSTGYGSLVLAKIVLFTPMVVLGASLNRVFAKYVLPCFRVVTNRFKGHGGLTQSDTVAPTDSRLFRIPRRINITIRSEVAIGMLILIIVGVLTNSAPVAQTTTAPPSYVPVPVLLSGLSEEGVNVTLKVFPLQVGSNHFETDFSDSRGNPVNSITQVSVRFRFLDRNVGVATASAVKSNTAQYSFDGTYFSFPGKWQLEVSAQRSGGYDIVTSFDVTVPSLSLRFSELTLSDGSEPYGIAVDNRGTVWFAETGTGQIASYDPTTKTLKNFQLSRTGSRPFYLTTDQNGLVWISETQYNSIVRFNPATNMFNEYPIPTAGAVPGGVVTDAKGNVWFTEEIAGKIGRLTPSSGVISEFPIPTADSIPIQLAVDAHGVVWFTEAKAGKLGRLNPLNGNMNEFAPVNSTLVGPTGITIGPDGGVWITEHGGNRITMFDPTNQSFKSFQLSDDKAFPFGLALYQKDRVWFVEHIANSIATLDLTTGRFDTFPIPNPTSDVQLLAVDSQGNVWFTLPASDVLGVLVPKTSSLELESNSNSGTLTQVVLILGAIIILAVPIVLVLGQRRMRRKA